MGDPTFPWPPGSATGTGAYPGGDVREALRVVLGELPDLPHLPELPARGTAAEPLGRTAALLVDLPVELLPSGWRLAERPGHDLVVARDLLAGDLDVLEELAGAYAGPFKIQAAGPWTLASGVELRRGDKMLADGGAVRDLVASLAEGLAGHVADVRRRVPGADVVLQLDEPALPRILAGRVPSASGLRALRAVEETEAAAQLVRVVEAVSSVPACCAIHCCARDAPVGLFNEVGVRAISVDTGVLSTASDDALGAALEAGLGLFLGVVPSDGLVTDAGLPTAGEAADTARGLLRRLGLASDEVAASVVLTPGCGLAAASPSYARAAIARCREAARLLAA
ncbi:MAG: methionine synthase [Streptosporangiaceae bacterium]